MHAPRVVARGTLAVLLVAGSGACSTPSSPPAATLTVPPMPRAGSTAEPAGATAHAFHYDLVLAITDGATTTKTPFTLDVSDQAPGSASFAKNVVIGKSARADVGATVKGKITMQADVPRLDVDAAISFADTAGTVHRAAAQGGAPTPPSVATTLLETTQDGRQLRLTATPTASAALGAESDGPPDAWTADVTIAQTRGGASVKTSTLSLSPAGDAPAVAKTLESVPLSVSDGGVSPRQDIGSRVKATGRRHANGVALDFDLELSAVEAGGSAVRIRKIHARGPLMAPWDRPTKAFSAEDEGHRYEVTITPHARR